MGRAAWHDSESARHTQLQAPTSLAAAREAAALISSPLIYVTLLPLPPVGLPTLPLIKPLRSKTMPCWL